MNTSTINQKVAEALSRVKSITDKKGVDIVQSSDVQRHDREILTLTGWLQEIIQGWYMLVRSDTAMGDSAAWYANFWDFLSVYLKNRFNNHYCLSAESSLALHVDEPFIPKQVIVMTPKNSGSITPLPYDSSLLIYKDSKNFPEKIETIKHLNIMPLPFALCKVTKIYFQKNPEQAEIACRLLKSTNELISIIAKNNFKTAANRLTGAYQFLGQHHIAQDLEDNLKMIGMKVTKQNPFEVSTPLLAKTRVRSPYVARIKFLWTIAREQIIAVFPEVPKKKKNAQRYLKDVDQIYSKDAYHSLSIEGYRVTHELIERVKNNHWNPDVHPNDKNTKNALAARGYYDAFLEVKKSIQRLLSGEDVGEVIRADHQKWYRALFYPNVHAGIITQDMLYGYRTDRVYLRGSRHTPLPKEAIVDAMETLLDCIVDETHPAVRAVMGHYLFVFIHPYMDGNGRMSRFLMNALFASGGYPWTVIDVKNRKRYLSSLQKADENKHFRPFAQLILDEMESSQN